MCSPVEQWKQQQVVVSIPPRFVGADRPGANAIGHLHPAEVGEQLTHSTWAGDFSLVAEGLMDLDMTQEFHAMVQKHGFRIVEQHIHLWTLERPAQMSVAGRVLQAEEDLIVLGLRMVVGGPLEYERRISKAWFAFHTQGARLTSKCLSLGAKKER